MIEIEVEDPAWREALPNVNEAVRNAAERALGSLPSSAAGGVDRRVSDGPGGRIHLAPQSPAELVLGPASGRTRGQSTAPQLCWRAEWSVTVLLTTDAAVRELNARFRGKDTPTNVLSFPAPESAWPHLGDVALAFGVVAREADEQGKRFEQHLAHLVAHGVLHLLGWDHEREDEAEAMEARERAVMATLGWPDPYAAAERAGAVDA